MRQALGIAEGTGEGFDTGKAGTRQYVVLLAYGAGEGPVALTATSQGEATCIRVVPAMRGMVSSRLSSLVEAALGSLAWKEADAVQGPGAQSGL